MNMKSNKIKIQMKLNKKKKPNSQNKQYFLSNKTKEKYCLKIRRKKSYRKQI